jgi:hypothetical protein
MMKFTYVTEIMTKNGQVYSGQNLASDGLAIQETEAK